MFKSCSSLIDLIIQSVIASYTDSYSVETSKVKQLYERELEDAKTLIEELARDKSRLEIASEKADAESRDALAKCVHRIRTTNESRSSIVCNRC
jgi:hypothetical protein